MRPLVLVVAALLLAGCAQDAPAAADDAPVEWSFTDIDGQTHARTSPPGNATVLFFMATWCVTCQKEAPMLARLHEAYKDDGVRFYSLDFDPTETPEQVRAWQARLDQPWPHGIDAGLSIQRAFDVTSQSSVVVLDAEGHVVRQWGHGYADEAAVRDAIERALAA